MTHVLVLPIPSMAGHRLPSLRPLPAPSSGTESLFQCETTACPAQNQPTTFPRFYYKPGPPGDTLLTNGHGERKSAKEDRLARLGTSPAFPSLPFPPRAWMSGHSLQHHHVITRGQSPLGALEQDRGPGPCPHRGGGPSPGLPCPWTSAHMREDSKASMTWASHYTQPNLNLSTQR